MDLVEFTPKAKLEWEYAGLRMEHAAANCPPDSWICGTPFFTEAERMSEEELKEAIKELKDANETL